MNILGISCFYHDSAACLLKDGKIIAAAQEERFTRRKHDSEFPEKAVRYCLDTAGIQISDIDYVAFYDKPLVKFERILETSLAFAPFGLSQFLRSMPVWLKQKLWIKDIIAQKLNYKGKILFCGHHESHAASAFYPSPFKEAAFLTMDGVGEWHTSSFGVGEGNELKILKSLDFPNSLGLLYSAFTYHAGFRVNSGEYKLMGLAPYGRPRFKDLILKEMVDLKEDGSFKLNIKYFGFCGGLRMTNSRFDRIFNVKPRIPESKIRQIDMDLAASIQNVTEEIMLRMSRYVFKVTGKDNLCLAGGVALNCVGNGRILKEGPFKEIWVQPASGDAGGALGAALAIWHKYLGSSRFTQSDNDSLQGSFLGPGYSDECIEGFLKNNNIPYSKADTQKLPELAAELIDKQNVIGWFQGRMEFGPRALGARSILADARSPEMQSRVNLKIKFRESFRPFAPSGLEEYASEGFDLTRKSPYMLFTAKVKQDKLLQAANLSANGLDSLKNIRSVIPAVTHVDNSARIQTVNSNDNKIYYGLLKSFYNLTGCPVIINTSFNVRGEPIVCTPEEAFNCFIRTDMDFLILGKFILDKKEQTATKNGISAVTFQELD